MRRSDTGKTAGDEVEIYWQTPSLAMTKRWSTKGHLPAMVWLTGLSGSGKTTIAHALDERLHDMRFHTAIIDAENIRHGLNRDLGFSPEDRTEACRRLAELGKVVVQAGLVAIVPCLSPMREHREHARNTLPVGLFYEIFVDTPLEVCVERDPKGLYESAYRGEIKDFTGVDSAYEAPLNPDLRLDTAGSSVDECVDEIVNLLIGSGLLDRRRTPRSEVLHS